MFMANHFIQRAFLKRQPGTANCEPFKGAVKALFDTNDVSFLRRPPAVSTPASLLLLNEHQ